MDDSSSPADKEIRLSPVEAEILEAFDAGHFDCAATRFIQQYGGEIFGFLAGRVGDPAVASDIFSEFTEDFWNGLPGFQWWTSIRGWGYTLARNAFYRHLKARKREGHAVSVPSDTGFHAVAEQVRSTTMMHLRTEVKSKMREIRERLPVDDQTLLILRIDRNLSWNELAAVMSGEGEGLSDAEIRRWSARLRQRFQTVKERLRKAAVAEGLVPAD